MPQFAQFVNLTDQPITLSASSSHPFTFDLADLDRTRTVLLQFMVSTATFTASGVPRLKLTVNNTSEGLDATLTNPGFAVPRVWQEVVAGSAFQSSNNLLLAECPSPASQATVTVSDFVVLYHAKTP